MAIDNKLRLAAEWEQQRAVMLTWPDMHTDWAPYLADIARVYIDMVRAIVSREKVVIVAKQPEEVSESFCELAPDLLDNPNIEVYACDTNDTWARDHGPLTLVKDEGASQNTLILDFRFNAWGDKFTWEADNEITRHLFDFGALGDEYESHDDFVLEGGSIETDGQGTLFTTEGCLLAPNRNQPLTRDEIETELKRRLHVDRVVWLPGLQLEGDDTDGHIDTIVRLAPNRTILYVDESLRQQIETATEGMLPYRLLALPMPEPVIYDGEQLPATYANYLVINGAVLMPTYDQPQLDLQAAEVLQEAFRDREIILIDALPVVRQHGSLHCLTMQLY